MTAQVLFFNVFSEKDPHINVVELPALLKDFKRHFKICT